ncbi:hypothetical protein GCM10018785_64870 [Streptomyces longispororuber]|uniref:Uncharacterized protein n=1 Tax=Streptomyces longispororuber TaxID=68230 RepID=A0A919DXP8_9ACTN|nr:hypothetical protein GCM10018785_64870 [Streptomyces longispororuber]
MDRGLVGPGADPAERGLVYGTAAAGTGLAVAAVAPAAPPLWAVALVGLVAFDLFGGAAANATAAAKRAFHAPGRTARHHLGFVAAHGQPFLLALAVPGLGWVAAAVLYALALAGAVAVTAAPGAVRRPVAFSATALALGVTTVTVDVPGELAWLAPVLFVKLLLGHLLPEESRG